jgi:hypothetical protein
MTKIIFKWQNLRIFLSIKKNNRDLTFKLIIKAITYNLNFKINNKV